MVDVAERHRRKTKTQAERDRRRPQVLREVVRNGEGRREPLAALVARYGDAA